jgi:UDP-GlcNAc:undecaprenyl-phosphate/decaprenyl-phosphate GlcNAc-1-phosphate transferase
LSEFASIIISASLMSFIGLWDDRRALRARVKLTLQFIPVILIFLAGTRVNWSLVENSVLNEFLNFGVTAFWILLITNGINYLDNADGIAAMTSASASAIFLLIAILNGQQLVSVLAAAVLGASLSFARYNLPLPKSTIFMGDSGSLFLGYLLAILGIKIRIPANTPEITWMVPIIVLAIPIFDIGLVFISRTRRGVSFFTGGVDHTTHRLARLGLNGLSVALTMSLVGGTLGLVAIIVTRASETEAYTIAASLLILALYILWQIEFKPSFQFRTGKEPPPQPQPSEVKI